LKVSVVLPVPLDNSFTYLVPAELEEEARVGCRVLVPFGKRRLTGLIVGYVEGEDEPYDLKPIHDVLDEVPSLTPEMLRLTRWISDYYLCGWGEAVRAALPPGMEIESRHVIERTETPAPAAWMNHKVAGQVLRYLDAHPETTLSAVRKQVRRVSLPLLRRLERDGLISMRLELSRTKVRIRLEKHVHLAPAFREPGAVDSLLAQLRGKKQVALIETLVAFEKRGDPEPPQAVVLSHAGASTATLNSLVDRGIVEVVEREVVRAPLDLKARRTGPAEAHEMHRAQRKALDAISKAIDQERFETFLLHGVTGSGKTEVYIAALKQVLSKGKTGIILVPEISLTPQTVRRFRAHFGEKIAVLHSRMSLGERFDVWRLLRNGFFSVVIGPRSAVLAPLENVGLIVVDEEHESSYKQFDPAPRYHARDVAIMRASMNGAVCVLGSATPSMETYQNARSGKYTLLEMHERVPVPGYDAAPLPDVRVVDLALEHRKHQLEGAVSEPLRAAIEARIERKEQVILLQNRRGYAPVIECRACGWSPYCRDCSVTLTYHKAKRHLRCHYCGITRRLPRACPKCGEVEIEMLGVGTQRVEEELRALFPEARILRMDLDTTGRKDAHHKLLDQFGRGDADILLGTQMVAKGLDFGRVTLVGIINADAGMLLPDFRSEERTFQLLTQVSGRAGRAGLRGEVILQTRRPRHSVIRFAAMHDYRGFIEAGLAEREQFGYPPFGRVVSVEFRGYNRETVEKLAGGWTELFQEKAAGLPVQTLGPEPAFVSRVKRMYRYHTILKAARDLRPAVLHHVIRLTQEAFGTVPSGCRVAIDVDAVGLL
jgi:primosomal protein N' (replication factor Y)